MTDILAGLTPDQYQFIQDWFLDNVHTDQDVEELTKSLLTCIEANNHQIVDNDTLAFNKMELYKDAHRAGYYEALTKFKAVMDEIYPTVASRCIALETAGETEAHKSWVRIARLISETWDW